MLRPTLSLPLFIQQSCRVLNYVDDSPAKIIDFTNNIQRFGMPTADRDWSLDKPVKEYYNENEDGTLKIRVCQSCFSTFETANICPYCGAVYETTPVEIQNFKEIELRKIEEAKEEQRQRYLNTVAEKVKNYTKPEECKTFYELVEYGKMHNFKPGWAYILAKRRRLIK